MQLPADFEPLWQPPAPGNTPGLSFVFDRQGLWVAGPERAPVLPDLPVPAGAHCIGRLGAQPCWAVDAGEAAPPEGIVARPLRALFDLLPDTLLAVAARAAQIVDFDRSHRFCGACGSATTVHDEGRARACPACGQVSYPRLAPAMIVLVKRDGPGGRELLLARNERFPEGLYSAVAGFVEPGESLEDCVHRETLEEIGVRVCNLRYFGSQMWPFPHSLMVGFIADWAGGEIVCQAGEIADARWFSPDALPVLPPRLSIARRMIDAACAEAVA